MTEVAPKKKKKVRGRLIQLSLSPFQIEGERNPNMHQFNIMSIPQKLSWVDSLFPSRDSYYN